MNIYGDTGKTSLLVLGICLASLISPLLRKPEHEDYEFDKLALRTQFNFQSSCNYNVVKLWYDPADPGFKINS